MKNRIGLPLLAMIGCTTMTYAQNNPIFFGGSGDGFVAAGYVQPTNDVLINRGGIGDGYAVATYAQAVVNHFRGGNGDGYVTASTGSPTADKIFFGGDADGIASATSGSPSVDKIFFGGFADGIASGTTGNPGVDRIFYGGRGDGWSSTYYLIIPLPLNLLSFTGRQQDGRHVLNWETVQEKQTDHFELERSATANNFRALGNVSAAGNASDKRTYGYIDEKPLRGDNFYRLKMVDVDGKSSYSSIVLLRLLQDNSVLKVFPNPAASVLNIEWSGKDDASEVLVDIYDASARLVGRKILKADQKLFRVDVASLAAGVYSIRIINQNEISVVKFIKQ